MLLGMLQDSNPFFIITAGLMLGLIHAFEPDHISSVSTQIIKNKTSNSKKHYLQNLIVTFSLQGALWGIGHTSSIIILGLLIVVISVNIPDNFFIGAEIIVGIMLVILGIFTFRNKSIFKQKHIHPHTHDNISHTHTHSHNENHKHGHKSYIIGCIHGIAGSGSLVVLAASTMNADMMIYFLILFGVSSIIGMMIASSILGMSFILLSKINSLANYLRYAVAGVSLIIGANIILTVGINNKFISLN